MNIDEVAARAIGYVCVDLVRTLTDVNRRSARVADRLGYDYIGLTTSSSFVVPEALIDHLETYDVELLIIPDIGHLRGRIPSAIVKRTSVHDLATGRTYERGGSQPVKETPSPRTAGRTAVT